METKILPNLNDKIIFGKNNFEKVEIWNKRKTVKIIVTNNKNEIAFVTNNVHGFYTLPGGGVDNGEELHKAAQREGEEEIFKKVKVEKTPFIFIEEFRAKDKNHYETFYFVGKAGEDIAEDNRTENEKNLDLAVKWFSLEEAENLVRNQFEQVKLGNVLYYNTAFNIVRDKLVLKYFVEKLL